MPLGFNRPYSLCLLSVVVVALNLLYLYDINLDKHSTEESHDIYNVENLCNSVIV